MSKEATYQVSIKEGRKTLLIGTYYVEKDGSSSYSPYDEKKAAERVSDSRFLSPRSSDGPIDFIASMISKENRVKGRRKEIYNCPPYVVTRVAEYTGDHFMVYRSCAKEGDPDFSTVDHERPHIEFGKDTGLTEWVTHYCFRKMSDGTYEAELDEAWYWGGGHLDGGTINRPIPEKWFKLPYDEFLDNVLTLAFAGYYLFTVEELKSKPGLKEFFGY